jgi:hypothetical protein
VQAFNFAKYHQANAINENGLYSFKNRNRNQIGTEIEEESSLNLKKNASYSGSILCFFLLRCGENAYETHEMDTIQGQ